MRIVSKSIRHVFLIIAFSMVSISPVNAEEYVVNQKDKKFDKENITINAGDTVVFKNSDPMSHNIHSLTADDPFDLGSFIKTEVRSHTFKNKGVHEVECAIHPFMLMTVTVE